MKKSSLAALALIPVFAFIVYSSFQVSEVECTVCIRFDGREVCRTVSAADRTEGIQSATDNACALLTSGRTNSMRCSRTAPARAECVELGQGD